MGNTSLFYYWPVPLKTYLVKAHRTRYSGAADMFSPDRVTHEWLRKLYASNKNPAACFPGIRFSRSEEEDFKTDAPPSEAAEICQKAFGVSKLWAVRVRVRYTVCHTTRVEKFIENWTFIPGYATRVLSGGIGNNSSRVIRTSNRMFRQYDQEIFWVDFKENRLSKVNLNGMFKACHRIEKLQSICHLCGQLGGKNDMPEDSCATTLLREQRKNLYLEVREEMKEENASSFADLQEIWKEFPAQVGRFLKGPSHSEWGFFSFSEGSCGMISHHTPEYVQDLVEQHKDMAARAAKTKAFKKKECVNCFIREYCGTYKAGSNYEKRFQNGDCDGAKLEEDILEKLPTEVPITDYAVRREIAVLDSFKKAGGYWGANVVLRGRFNDSNAGRKLTRKYEVRPVFDIDGGGKLIRGVSLHHNREGSDAPTIFLSWENMHKDIGQFDVHVDPLKRVLGLESSRHFNTILHTPITRLMPHEVVRPLLIPKEPARGPISQLKPQWLLQRYVLSVICKLASYSRYQERLLRVKETQSQAFDRVCIDSGRIQEVYVYRLAKNGPMGLGDYSVKLVEWKESHQRATVHHVNLLQLIAMNWERLQ